MILTNFSITKVIFRVLCGFFVALVIRKSKTCFLSKTNLFLQVTYFCSTCLIFVNYLSFVTCSTSNLVLCLTLDLFFVILILYQEF